MRLRCLLAVLFVVAPGCSPAVPRAEPAGQAADNDAAPEIVEPPELSINGEPGKPVTWCWGGGCVDGFLHDPRMAPAIAAPFVTRIPEGSQIEGVRAIFPGAPGRQRSREVPFNRDWIGDVPDDAVMLNVGISFADGGDASYYWALNRPVGLP